MKKILIILACMGLFVACDTHDVSNDTGSSDGIVGSMAKFACKGNYLYIVDNNSLTTYDVSDSSQIRFKTKVAVGGNMETLFLTDSLLFMGSTSGMYIYSLKDPNIPRFVSQYIHLTSCDPVVVQGQYAFVTLRSNSDAWACSRNVNELQVIDIKNLFNPVQKATYSMANPKGLAIDGDRLFICDGMDLVVMDARDPLRMVKLKSCELDGTPYDVIAKNGLLTVSYSAGIKQYRYDGDSIQQLSSVY